ncbi:MULTISPECIES: DUF7482 domain-containing protein [unclassified Amycolatopsis]|uniref:DUF7482 domain-containing protein n=1 Tax=unclassified Amycolatopsis TaxID=2618356 RepID=UPI002E140D72|nr:MULTISPECIES: hypothetical protein [unclassified Amycolatopsis]WSJ81625.1 hypothetical protein OG439_22320 [Amycolatopsis sp. NBC_01307]WSK74997.1 hypothetical protein OG570_26745 [Amycolatopsis sp. NBC_01286]
MREPLSRLVRTAALVSLVGGGIVLSAGPASALEPSESEVLPSAISFDGHAGLPPSTAQTVTLPLHVGTGPDGRLVYYIVTETSSAADAVDRGVNFSPKLANALGTPAVQSTGTDRLGRVRFSGTVDFSPTRAVTPGAAPTYFPPTSATPGAVGDPGYSPLTTDGDGVVVNMPQVANSSGQNDSVVSINKVTLRVTLSLFGGFYDDHPVLYIRTEASDPLLAAIESSTYAPNLNAAPGLASDDPATSAREAIVPIVNGPTGIGNPQRQGLNSALAGEGAPLNIIQEDPAPPGDDSSPFYSPVWDVTPGVWTDAAITSGARTQLRSITEAEQQAHDGNLISFGNGPRNDHVDLNAAQFVSLCPVMAVLPIPGI